MVKKIIFLVLSVFLFGCNSQGVPVAVTSTAIPSSLLTQFVRPFILPTATVENTFCPPKEISNAMPEVGHIGLQIPSEPKGIKRLDSLSIGSSNQYFIGLSLMLEGGRQHLFWLEKSCHDKNGQQFTQIIDEIVLPLLTDDEIAVTTCTLTNIEDSKATAMGIFQEEVISGKTYWRVNVSKAWLINTEIWSFEEIPVENLEDVSCVYENGQS